MRMLTFPSGKPAVLHISLAVLACAISALASAQTYKWVDAQGRTHYGDTPPAGARARVVEGGVNVVTTPSATASAPARTTPPAPPRETAAPTASPAGDYEQRLAQRQRMIERCERNRGVDCEDEVDALLDGVPYASYADWPAYGRPPLWPSHPPRPRPPRPPAKPKTEEPPRMAPWPRRDG